MQKIFMRLYTLLFVLALPFTDRANHSFKGIIKWLPLLLVVLTVSCIPQKELLYLQEKDSIVEYETVTEITGKYILQTNDYLFIQVSTFDPKLSEFFNATQGNSSSQSTQNNLFMYMVDDNMDIDFPYAGKINLRGCNLEQAKTKIRVALKPYLKDFNLVVRLGSNSFTILGEVKSPGRHTMSKDQITIFEALGIAGDLTAYGKRKDMKIVRPQADGSYETYVVDITDHKIIGSDKYFIYPNDLIYVRPIRAKQLGIGESFSLGIFSSLLALALTVVTLTR
ncbi:polysaccharide biosynthesis/export family protein [Saccharicrinis fermentans]|uniref:Polysaccharide export protein Wza n=1 Tax=Saccharicrinis fermentans DSM 9555 = JCM 21142 TaxID=869213 RepID=W7XZ03_9BACT|nr:polysaccharide biosynthesis/export family protein [Saccharicrinis fermentans]GAF03895.1 polysaccharide export protein Wza [Saccharicrinis fermentans DSM 9555 = JCM 21142]